MNSALLAVYYDFVEDLKSLSKCTDRGVACIICDSTLLQVLSIGVNGGPRGTSIDCLCAEDTKYSCIHAEANALIKLSVAMPDKVMICSLEPCAQCASMIVNEQYGFATLLYLEPWKEPLAQSILNEAGIKTGQLLPDGAVLWD